MPRPDSAPSLLWLRRDLRLRDHPALHAACAAGGPVIPVFIWDGVEAERLGAAARWRLERSLAALSEDLAAIGGRLILAEGDAAGTLLRLAGETGARRVFWSRYYEAAGIARDKAVKAALAEAGLEAGGRPGFLLREPWETAPQSGGFYKVYGPFQRAFASAYEPGETLAPPGAWPGVWPAPERWPESLALGALRLSAPMRRGAAILQKRAPAGETAALARLERFLEEGLGAYAADRDRLDRDGTSRLSAALSLGEISPQLVWRRVAQAAAATPERRGGAEKFLKELIWREFAWHLAYHAPQIRERHWREEWAAFPWRAGAAAEPELTAWTRGRTGIAVIDAAMRELYVTGIMHNRARMLVGSYLTKNLLIHWRAGEAWFADHLVDFDPAANAMGWQWVAGSGPDAAPYFRIFNPETQAEKFDPDGVYRHRWLSPESAEARDFHEACPRSWAMRPEDPPAEPSIGLKEGRERALAAYEAMRAGRALRPLD